jgi:hypothetical protein
MCPHGAPRRCLRVLCRARTFVGMLVCVSVRAHACVRACMCLTTRRYLLRRSLCGAPEERSCLVRACCWAEARTRIGRSRCGSFEGDRASHARAVPPREVRSRLGGVRAWAACVFEARSRRGARPRRPPKLQLRACARSRPPPRARAAAARGCPPPARGGHSAAPTSPPRPPLTAP